MSASDKISRMEQEYILQEGLRLGLFFFETVKQVVIAVYKQLIY
jgi:hypothetical protein